MFVLGHVERYHFWYEVARQTGYAPITERALCNYICRVDFEPGWEPGDPEVSYRIISSKQKNRSAFAL